MFEGDFPDDASQPESWIDEYGGVPEGSTSLSWLTEDDLPSIEALLQCRFCGHVTGSGGSIEVPCRTGNCIELCCARCGENLGGWGPVGCPCQGRDPQLRRIRQLYRARRR